MWFRRDLRLADNAALTAAATRAWTVACVCVVEDGGVADAWAPGAAARAWRSRSLAALDAELRDRGGGLHALRGHPARSLVRFALAHDASLVCCTRDHSPTGLAEEAAVREELSHEGVELLATPGELLVGPHEVMNAAGGPYRLFTPYHRAWRAAWYPAEPLLVPDRTRFLPPSRPFEPPTAPQAALDAVERFSAHRGATPGERGAAARLAAFAGDTLDRYPSERERPALDVTSHLSPALSHGEISPRQVAAAITAASAGSEAKRTFLRQLAWREFAYQTAHHFPSLPDEPFRREFAHMRWRDDADALEAWREGRTGSPLVDAGMRQLRETGWLHNRVRLVAASFLVKDLLLPWKEGERVFWERLIDADLALNAFNWQWVAGSGADAGPFFRVMDPALQGTRFDPDGAYVRRWVPELADVPNRWIHRPWEAPAEELARAGVVLGKSYPRPIVEHRAARRRALAAWQAAKATAGREA